MGGLADPFGFNGLVEEWVGLVYGVFVLCGHFAGHVVTRCGGCAFGFNGLCVEAGGESALFEFGVVDLLRHFSQIGAIHREESFVGIKAVLPAEMFGIGGLHAASSV